MEDTQVKELNKNKRPISGCYRKPKIEGEIMENTQEVKTYTNGDEQLCDYFKLIKLLIRLQKFKKHDDAMPEKQSENPADQGKQEKEPNDICKNITLQKEAIKLNTETTLKAGNIRLPLEIMRKRYKLKEDEVITLCMLALDNVDPMAGVKNNKTHLLYLVCEGDYNKILISSGIFDSSSVLCKNQLIDCCQRGNDVDLGFKARKYIYSSNANKAVSDKENAQRNVSRPIVLLSPQEIHTWISKTVIGQDRAKRMLSVAAHTHLKRISAKEGELKPGKSNIMLVGPTGSGKTLLARTLAGIMDVPMIIVDATQYTEMGYVGGDVGDMILQLIEAARGDKSNAEKGIIFIDEIDKIAARDCGSSHTTGRDVSGKSVQEELLRFLDGAQTSITSKVGYSSQTIQMDLSKVLFIASGAFANMRSKPCGNQSIAGFTGSKDVCQARQSGLRVHSELSNDLINYGMIPEFMGRFPILVELSELNKSELLDIIRKPTNSLLAQYRNLYGDISFSEDALEFIVEQSIKRKSGARGLRAIIEETLSPIIFERSIDANKFELTLTKEDLLKQA